MDKKWSDEEIKKLFPQSAGELRGFSSQLHSSKMGITGSQIDMMLQLAGERFEQIQAGGHLSENDRAVLLQTRNLFLEAGNACWDMNHNKRPNRKLIDINYDIHNLRPNLDGLLVKLGIDPSGFKNQRD